MESSRQSSMAQLSAWTDVMRKTTKTSETQAKRIEVDEEYEDEFEDYDEDFETETPVKAPPKPTVPAKSHIDPVRLSASKQSADVVSANRINNYSNLGASIAKSITDPRVVRIQRVRASGVLNLQMEKFTNVNIIPSTRYELYMQQLRKAESSIKQIGTPLDLDARDVEINTEDVFMVNEEVQYCYGDDTLLYQLMDTIASSKRSSSMKHHTSVQQLLLANKGSLSDNPSEEMDNFQMTGTLSLFLQKSSLIFDGLFGLQSLSNNGSQSTESDRQLIISKHHSRLDYGVRSTDGSLELIKFRKISFVSISKINPNIFLAYHEFPDDNEVETDLRPYKGLISVWDSCSEMAPLYLLEVSGQLTTSCFSNLQQYIVVAGSTDGTLHLWDLREPSGVHHDSDSIDLKVAKGIRSPTYSSHPSIALANDVDEDIIHSSGVTCLEPIDFVNNSVTSFSRTSQFVSLDEGGIVIFWITNERQNILNENLRRSPWGNVYLLATRQIELKFTSPRSFVGKFEKSKVHSSDFLDLKHPIFRASNCVLASIPSDSTSILVGDTDGNVHRYGRSGEAISPSCFHRVNVVTTVATTTGDNEIQLKHHLKSFQRVTCIAVRPVTVKSSMELMLVGRADGSMDLFQLGDEYPIFSWTMPKQKFDAAYNDMKWISWLGELQFLAVTSHGFLYYFDLEEKVSEPYLSEKLPIDSEMFHFVASVSSPRHGLHETRLVIGATEWNLKLLSWCLNKGLVKTSSTENIRAFEENLSSLSNKAKQSAEINFI